MSQSFGTSVTTPCTPPQRAGAERACTEFVSWLIQRLGAVMISPDSPRGTCFERLSDARGDVNVAQQAGNSPEHIGSLRVYRGQAGLHKLVELQIAAPAQQLVSHSLLAFTAPDSAVPHFVMDAVLAGPRASLHIDLIPRIPLEQHEAYHAHCFAPLRVVRRDMARDKRLGSGQDTAKLTGPRSPYEALCNLPTEQLEVARSYARRYFEHWCSMLGAPLPRQATAGLDRGELASRDRQTRTAIFHRDSDPFWRKLDAVVGADSVNRILQELTSSAIQTKA